MPSESVRSVEPLAAKLGRPGNWCRSAHLTLSLFPAVAVLLLACPAWSLAEAASAPDSTRVSLLQLAVLTFDDVRVVTDGKRLVTHGPIVSSDGLLLSRGGGEWKITSERQPRERLITWAEIESIEVRKGGSGAVVLAWAVAGFAIGSAIVVAQSLPLAFSGQESDQRPILIGLVGGATLGALMGAPGRWKPVYP